LTTEAPHDDLKEKKRGFSGLFVLRKASLDTLLLLTAEGRICEDNVYALLLPDLGEFVAQRVAGVDMWRV